MIYKRQDGSTFEAMKYTGDNINEIINWSGAHKAEHKDELGEIYETMTLVTPTGSEVMVGDWISDDGSVYKMMLCEEA